MSEYVSLTNLKHVTRLACECGAPRLERQDAVEKLIRRAHPPHIAARLAREAAGADGRRQGLFYHNT